MAIYMKVQGVSGSVTSKGHENWIELDSVHFGVSIPVQTNTGDIRARVKGAPTVGEMHLAKSVDKSSIDLFTHAVQSTSIPEVTIHYCKTAETATSYHSFILKKVIISEFAEAHDSMSHAPREMIRMNFVAIEKSVTPRDASNNLGSPMKAGYDLEIASTM